MSRSTRRRPIARHGQLRTPGRISQLVKLIALSLAIVLVSGVGVVAFILYDATSTLADHSVTLEGEKELPPNIGEFKGGFNLVLTGVDKCETKYAHLFAERCSGPDANTKLNDVNLLVHVSEEPRRVTVISFPRDLMIEIPQCTDKDGDVHSAMSKQQINVAYGVAGLSCVVKTITHLTGLDIQFAAAVTFGGVIEITKAIGGVRVCVASDLHDPHTNLNLTKGPHKLSGLAALQFLRTRYGVGDGSDLGRIGNQQQYMTNLARKLISGEVLGNPALMLNLASTGIRNLEPSTSLADPMMIVQIALALKSVSFDDIVFVQYPSFTDPDDADRVVPNYAAADVLWAALESNAQLKITHKNGGSDGVVVTDPETPAPTDSPKPTASSSPTNVVELPEAIRGNAASQTTCSTGRDAR